MEFNEIKLETFGCTFGKALLERLHKKNRVIISFFWDYFSSLSRAFEVISVCGTVKKKWLSVNT